MTVPAGVLLLSADTIHAITGVLTSLFTSDIMEKISGKESKQRYL